MHFHFILKLKCAVRMKNLNSENGPFGPSSESDSKFIGIKVIAMLVLFDFKYVAIFTSIEYFFLYLFIKPIVIHSSMHMETEKTKFLCDSVSISLLRDQNL